MWRVALLLDLENDRLPASKRTRHHAFLHHLRIDHLAATYVAYPDDFVGQAVAKGFAGGGGFDTVLAGNYLDRLPALDRHGLFEQRRGDGLSGAYAALGSHADHLARAVVVAAPGIGDVDALQFDIVGADGLAAFDDAFGMHDR